MGKALLVRGGFPLSTSSGAEANLFGSQTTNTTEANSQYSATEGADFTGLRFRITAGGSGTNTCTFRDAGAGGQNVASRSSTGTAEDTTHTDTLTAGDLFNLAYTDTGSNPSYLWTAANVEFASGHGNFHGAGGFTAVVADVASATRYFPISGLLPDDGASAIAQAQWKNRGYTSIEAFQVRVTANARTNDSVFSVNVNGSNVGTAITFGAGATGLQTVTGMGLSLSDGDLVCISLALSTGVEDLSISLVGVTLKSTDEHSEVWAQNSGGATSAGSATARYYTIGGVITNSPGATESDYRIKVGFAARCRNLRIYLSANTYTSSATLKLMVNGAAQITTTIGSGVTGWIENTSDYFEIDDDDELSLEIDEGGSNTITIHAMGLTLGAIPPLGVDANSGSYAVTGQTTGLQYGYALTADAGSYAVTGQTVTLQKGLPLAADPGSYAVTGQTAGVELGRMVGADPGAYAVTGQTVTLTRDLPLTADPGSYAVGGTDAALEHDRTLTADPGSYAVSGQTTGLFYGYALTADAGSYSLSGTDAALEYGWVISADAGSYAVSGTDADLTITALGSIDADPGSYAVTGQTAGLFYGYAVSADAGSYSVNGQTVSLEYGYALAIEGGSYSVTGNVAALEWDRQLTADAGSYAVTGTDADLTITALGSIDADPGSYAVSGQTVGVLYARLIVAEAGGYTVSGVDATLAVAKSVAADAGAYDWAGSDVELDGGTLFIARIAPPELRRPGSRFNDRRFNEGGFRPLRK